MGNSISHVEVVGKDGAALQNFYSQLFGWEFDTDNDFGYGNLDGAGTNVSVGVGGVGEEGQPGHATFYVEVDDLEATLEKAGSLGGQTVVPVTVIPDMVTFALLADPEGNVIGITKGG